VQSTLSTFEKWRTWAGKWCEFVTESVYMASLSLLYSHTRLQYHISSKQNIHGTLTSNMVDVDKTLDFARRGLLRSIEAVALYVPEYDCPSSHVMVPGTHRAALVCRVSSEPSPTQLYLYGHCIALRTNGLSNAPQFTPEYMSRACPALHTARPLVGATMHHRAAL